MISKALIEQYSGDPVQLDLFASSDPRLAGVPNWPLQAPAGPHPILKEYVKAWTPAKDKPAERDPNGKAMNEPGAKADADKLRPTLIFRDMARALEKVVEIGTAGANKYTDGGWLQVPNGEERYEDADLRHMLKRFKGEDLDSDSHSLHLAHEAWNALAKLELHLRELEKAKVKA